MVVGGGTFERRSGHKGEVLMNGISDLTKQCASLGHVRAEKEDSHPQAKKPARHQTCWDFDLESLACRVMRNKCLLFTSHPVYGILLLQPDLVETIL